MEAPIVFSAEEGGLLNLFPIPTKGTEQRELKEKEEKDALRPPTSTFTP